MIVEMLLVVKAYSPYDVIDASYRAKHPIPITASGNLCSEHPYGIAALFSKFPIGTKISIPGYQDGKFITVDDTGGYLRKHKGSWIEVRYKTTQEAKQWGRRNLIVRVLYK